MGEGTEWLGDGGKRRWGWGGKIPQGIGFMKLLGYLCFGSKCFVIFAIAEGHGNTWLSPINKGKTLKIEDEKSFKISRRYESK